MSRATTRAYIQVCKTQIIRNLTYKFEVYGNVLLQNVIMIAGACFWNALFAGGGTVKGMDRDTMLVYTVVSSMISVLLTTNVEHRIMQAVEKGTIAIDLMRPVNVFGVFFAEDAASVISRFFQNLLPILIVGSLFVRIPKPASVRSFLLFLVSLLLAFGINWLLACMFGMLSFWAVSMDALYQVKKHLIRLLSGSIIPLCFFPERLSELLNLLPFACLYQMPLDLYIGNYDMARLQRSFLVQGVWFVVLLLLFFLLQRRVLHRVMIQGG